MKIKAKKSLGQNFLIDKNIIKSIVNVGDVKKNNVILEVGPGTGNLTEYILKKNPKKLFVIEKDSNLVNLLNGKFSDKISILNEDILKFDLNNISKEKIIIFGNLPYNISTKILTQWITTHEKFKCYKKLILMFQKEVADRIIAKTQTKEFSRLSVLSNWRLEIKKHFNITKNCFFPKPKINSTLLSFKPKKINTYDLKNPKNLEKVTRILFSNRRKMINKNFSKLFKKKLPLLKNLDIDLSKRPEELNSEMFYKIAVQYEKLFG